MHFGVNLNNREPLIAPEYSLQDLLDLSTLVEANGFDSVWVGDSLFSKPRWEAISLLSAISQRTEQVKLGTSCLVTSTRNPLYLALEWATLDVLSNGRTILGACMGNPEEGVRREFAALGLDFKKRAGIFEEGLSVLRSLWSEGSVSFQGEHFTYDDVSFYSGTEMGPLMPVQSPPPIWVVSNIRLLGDLDSEIANRRLERACRRIVELGQGWLTCCRAQHPEEVVEQLGYLNEAAAAMGVDISDYAISYQVTMNIKDSEAEAEAAFDQYISQYYPELSQSMDLSNWGPVGRPDQIVEWLDTFRQAGVTHFVCRFGDLDQFGQVERFAKEILPHFNQN
ncbi:MAG: LLM class flavin-dependent oxidoreductase [Actinobacteria bacterium]|jgi:alkanesulfonate monooxygenase SsuD/methylene tetrahydromethanopterin reductase-like flavin-dependent oxidoreductase (luciferase family)|nr:LLM class flavin-dependent oxidoreductase [Actinomycetota bacterium]